MYKLLRIFGINRVYYGHYPFINIIVSNLVFLTFRYRRYRLQNHFSKLAGKKKQTVVLINDSSVKDKLQLFLDKGFNRLNIGGGNKNFKEFVNIDFVSHSTIEREVVANILDLSFIPDNCIQQVHSNHLVEHITQQQFEVFLKDCIRILKSGGVFSMRCPNALGVSYGFFFDVVPETEHQDFLKLGYPAEEDFCNPLDGWYHKDLYGFYHWIYAQTGNIENVHLNILTPTKLKKTVEAAGFKILKMTDPETSNLVLIAKKE